jgi:cell division septal protein FtsQ
MSRRTPLRVEPEQHYWRRRANRRVRKRRITRNLMQWTLVLAVNALMAAVICYGAGRGLRALAASAEFSLERVEVEGAHRVSDERIRAALTPFMQRNLFDIDLAEVGRVAAADPWVLGSSVKRVLPDTLRVSLHERTPSALAVIGGLVHLVDSTGYVIGPSGPATADDLPVLTGLDGYSGEELAQALRRGVRLVERMRMRAPLLAEEISELDLSRPELLAARTVHPGPRLLLDPLAVERNVNPYLRLRREIERGYGALEYVDLRWSDRISVMPAMSSAGGNR